MKVAIIGAGASGLTAGWELKHQGIEVDIFEAHSKPGGCASYFRRPLENEKVLFDDGATVLWGLRDGEFLHSLLKKWGVESAKFSSQNFLRFSSGDKNYELDSGNESQWISSLQRAFPKDKEFTRQHFPHFFKISKQLNKALYKIPAEKLFELNNILANIHLLPEFAELLPYYLKYHGSFSDLISNCSSEFKEWVDMTLFVTLQARSPEVESFYAISALCFFPLGAGAMDGGMASLFDPLLLNFPSVHSRIFMRTPILKITQDKGYQIHSSEKVYGSYSHVLLSSPRWNSAELFENKLFDEPRLEWDQIKNRLWSAVVAYIATEDDPRLPGEAYNHHVKMGEQEIFFSVSKRNDSKRASAKWRLATATSHEELGQWNYPNYIKKKDFPGRDLYEKQKKAKELLFREAAKKVFSTELKFIEIASPKTFSHYTRRKEGCVGGIPLLKEFAFWKSPSQETLLPNVYQIGDTAFPGQSVVNCAVGALAAVRKLLRNS